MSATAPTVRVAHLVIGGDVAGGQLVALQLARALLERGGTPLVIVPAQGTFTELLARERIATHELDLGRLARADAPLRLARLLVRERVDLLHTHTMLAGNVHARLAGLLARVPVVSHIHIEDAFRPQPAVRLVQQLLDNATARLCARVIAVSDGTRDALLRQGYPAAKTTTIRNGIDAEAVAAVAGDGEGARRSLGVAATAPLIGEIARLCDVKGQLELIRAVARLSDRLPKLRLVLVGDDLESAGAYRVRLEKEARDLGVADRVIFAGYRRDVPAVLASLDVLALPSHAEGLPIVVLEAMAVGTPVVATAVGGTPELVEDGVTGVLVPPGDPERLADALGALLGSPGRRGSMGVAARERVRTRFSVGAASGRVLDVYRDVLGTS